MVWQSVELRMTSWPSLLFFTLILYPIAVFHRASGVEGCSSEPLAMKHFSITICIHLRENFACNDI
jgi:hypothetical protein